VNELFLLAQLDASPRQWLILLALGVIVAFILWLNLRGRSSGGWPRQGRREIEAANADARATREGMEQQFRWYVDPLDGTTNFAHGVPQFCVSMGLEQRAGNVGAEDDGTLVAGVIYDPMRDELYCAEKGRGALSTPDPAGSVCDSSSSQRNGR
jgi:hypothetical protein